MNPNLTHHQKELVIKAVFLMMEYLKERPFATNDDFIMDLLQAKMEIK